MRCASCLDSPASSAGWQITASPRPPRSLRMNDAIWIFALWGAAALVVGWTWIPALLSGLGATRYANGGTEDPALLQTASEEDYLFWQRQLSARGYEPLGTGFMRLTLYGRDWRYETQVRAFRSA